MKLLKYIPLQIVLCLIIGIVMGYFEIFSFQTLFFSITLSLFILGFSYLLHRNGEKFNLVFVLFTYISFIIIGNISIYFKNDLNKSNHYSKYLSNESVKMVLIIEDVLRPNNYYDNYEARIVKINETEVSGKIKLNVFKDTLRSNLNVGNKVFVFSTLVDIEPPKNPYQFNYKKYLDKQQVYHQVTIEPYNILLLNKDTKTLSSFAHNIRASINQALLENDFEGDELAIINALLLGQRKDISKDILENFQKAGAMHILALSGLHIGIILIILNFILKPIESIKHGKTLKLIIVVSLLWLFAIIAGLSPSIIRAVTMFTALAIAMATQSSINTYKSLIASAFVLLIINPYYLFDVGFQFSYLAVFFILWLHPFFNNLWNPKLKIVKFFWNILTVSIAAQLGVLPLSLLYFHQFPALFFITNLVVIPMVTVILGLGILIILLALINLLPEIIASAFEKIIVLLNLFIEWIARQESFLFQNISITLIVVILFYLFIIFLFKWFYSKRPAHLITTLGLLAIFLISELVEKYHIYTKNEFVVLNKSKHSAIIKRNGKHVNYYHNFNVDTVDTNITTYLVGSNTELNSSTNHIKNIYKINGKRLLVVDSLAIFSVKDLNSYYVLLSQSPKVNLERLIQQNSPKIIIADASNYKSYVSRWQKTCKKYNIKFHYTVTNGAFTIKM